MEHLGSDRWRAELDLEVVGEYRYSVSGRVDRFRTWVHDLAKRLEAGQDVSVDLLIGAELVEGSAARAASTDAPDSRRLREWAATLRTDTDASERGRAATAGELMELVDR